MSVVVIGMEEPDRCPCELAGGYDIPYPCFAGAGSPYMHKEFYQCVDDGSRPDWCPIRHLPEKHGRLIDAKAFEDQNKYFWGRDFINPKYEDTLQDLFEQAPTIIEAEGE